MNKPLHTNISLLHICKTSVFTAAGMISFFFLMKLCNLNTIPELRFFNFVFVFFGVRHILLYTRSHNSGIRLHSAMMIGFVTVFFTSALFAAFMFSYLMLDPTFMFMLRLSQPYGNYLTPASAALVTFLEGVVTAAVIAIPVLRTMKRKEAAIAAKTISQLAN